MREADKGIPTDLLDNALDDIKLVAANDDLLSLIQSVEGIKFWLDPRTENVSRNASGVDSDGTVVYGSDVTLNINTILAGGGLVATDSNAGRDEVALVGVGLEADEIRAEHSIENLPSTWIR